MNPSVQTPARKSAPWIAVSLAAVVAVSLAACGDDSNKAATTAAPTTAAATTVAPTTAAPTTAAPATTVTATTAPAGAAATGTSVAVTEKEFAIGLAQTSLSAGSTTFSISNTGQFKHNLVVEGNGAEAKSATFEKGQNGTLTVDLKPGTYEVYCSIPTHRGKGMDTTITVK
ncbi:MAG: hypothetical protein JWL70_2640 [Acidimicrobiia bacterium]|nr:hypothetical protein [Acidimicrobiia bacterium]